VLSHRFYVSLTNNHDFCGEEGGHDDNSDGSDGNSSLETFEEELTDEAEGIYCRAKRISGISEIRDETVGMRMIDDDHAFFEQMKLDFYLRKTVKDMFENARRHDVVEEDEGKKSSIMTVTRCLSNRAADLCCQLAKVPSM
jgi:hypothetical protein